MAGGRLGGLSRQERVLAALLSIWSVVSGDESDIACFSVALALRRRSLVGVEKGDGLQAEIRLPRLSFITAGARASAPLGDVLRGSPTRH
jgi:hypothetical protein